MDCPLGHEKFVDPCVELIWSALRFRSLAAKFAIFTVTTYFAHGFEQYRHIKVVRGSGTTVDRNRKPEYWVRSDRLGLASLQASSTAHRQVKLSVGAEPLTLRGR